MSGPVVDVLAKDRVRAATLVAPGRYEIRDYPVPDPAPGCVVVRMALSGICGTDKHTYQGYTTQYAGTEAAKEIPFPIIQGHENVGTVAAIGPTPAVGRTRTSTASPSRSATASSSAPTSSAASATTAAATSRTSPART